jgi:hypothetical protein
VASLEAGQVSPLASLVDEIRLHDALAVLVRRLAAGSPADLLEAHLIVQTCELAQRPTKPFWPWQQPLSSTSGGTAEPHLLGIAPMDGKSWDTRRKPWERPFIANADCQQIARAYPRPDPAWLASALRGQVPAAALLVALAGPFGDPDAVWMRPGDPAVAAWLQDTLERLAGALRTGNTALTDATFRWLANARVHESDRPALLQAHRQLSDAVIAGLQARHAAGEIQVPTELISSGPVSGEWPLHPRAQCLVHRIVVPTVQVKHRQLMLDPLELDRMMADRSQSADFSAVRALFSTDPQLLDTWCPI